MPHTRTKEDKGLIRTFTGLVSSDEYIAEIERNQATEDFDKLHFVINDFTNATAASDWYETLPYVAAITKAAKSYNRHLRIVYVTQDEAFSKSAWDAYKECGHSSEEFAVFPAFDAAKAWATRP